MTTEKEILDFYNYELNSGKHVDIEWLRNQRYLIGRYHLERRFGKNIVNSVIGPRKPLEQAEELIFDSKDKGNDDALKILSLLLEECEETLDATNPIREKCEELKTRTNVAFYTVKSLFDELKEEATK